MHIMEEILQFELISTQDHNFQAALYGLEDHAIAQVVSHWPLTADVWVHTPVSSCGVRNCTGAGLIPEFFCPPPP